MRFIVPLVVAAASLMLVGCGEDLPHGCAFGLFASSRGIDRVEVETRSGSTSSDADVFLDIGVATGSTATFDLDDSHDNFEAGDVDNFDYDLSVPFAFNAVTSMSIR